MTNQVQQPLVDLTLLDPPFEGAPRRHRRRAPPGDAARDLAGRIFRCMAKKRYSFPRLRSYFTIVYLEGVTPTGRPNDNKPNAFNDRRLVLAIKDNVPVEIGNWQATTEPG